MQRLRAQLPSRAMTLDRVRRDSSTTARSPGSSGFPTLRPLSPSSRPRWRSCRPATADAGTQRDGGLLFDSVVGVDMTRIDDLPVTLLNGRLPDPNSTTEVAVTLDYLNRIGVDKANAQAVVGTELTLGAPQEFAFGREHRFRARWSRVQVVGVVSQEASDGLVLAPLQLARAAHAWGLAGSVDQGPRHRPIAVYRAVRRRARASST